jgi:hypothetical protein
VKANTIRVVGLLCLLADSALIASGCGEVVPADAEENQLCAKKACDRGDCPSRGAGKHGANGGAGGGCSMGRDAAGGNPAGAGTGGAAATDSYIPPCAACARAEACCKAEGLTDCDYTAACASAAPDKAQYYIALCRMVLKDLAGASKTLPDACGS